jgi:hypothetical protein
VLLAATYSRAGSFDWKLHGSRFLLLAAEEQLFPVAGSSCCWQYMLPLTVTAAATPWKQLQSKRVCSAPHGRFARPPQVFSAICVIFAHGANDSAYAAGPLAGIYTVYKHGFLPSKVTPPVWVVFISASSMVIGLATYGYNVTRAMGTKMSKLSASRGFAAELSTATVILIASQCAPSLFCALAAAFLQACCLLAGLVWAAAGSTVFPRASSMQVEPGHRMMFTRCCALLWYRLPSCSYFHPANLQLLLPCQNCAQADSASWQPLMSALCAPPALRTSVHKCTDIHCGSLCWSAATSPAARCALFQYRVRQLFARIDWPRSRQLRMLADLCTLTSNCPSLLQQMGMLAALTVHY